MWNFFSFARQNKRREQLPSRAAACGVMMEALGDRVLPSAAAPSLPPADAIVLSFSSTVTTQQQRSLRVRSL